MAARMDEATLRAAIPPHTGTVTLRGLTEPVTVVRDTIGVPHIRAGSVWDAFFAQGYVHAQDRLWQMEYDRRRAAGRWAEVAGAHVLAHDLLMRRVRMAASARLDYEAMDADTRAMFDAYAAGVNAFIQTTDVLPAEYALAGIMPEPWEPWHSCGVYKVRHILMGVTGSKLWRLRGLLAGGPALVETLRAGAAIPGPLILPPGATYDTAALGGAALESAAALFAEGWETGSGSNSWAVAGARTVSGMPLLCGDSHRALDTPSVYYQNHLACPEWDVIGFSFGGVPAFPHFGHNAHVAWCITHAGADYHDLYIERFAPGDPTRYEYRGEWHAAARTRETVSVRGGDPVEVDVTVTRHGPVILGDPASGTAVTLKYTALARPYAGFGTFLPMLAATDTDDLDAKMAAWVDPANNLLMADTRGNIAYLTRGDIPVRARANAWLPVPGWTGEHEWEGRIPHRDLPRQKNPASGFFATANNRIVGDDYPHFLTLDYAPPFRAARITARLEATTRATPAMMETIHAEKRSLPALTYLSHLPHLTPLDEGSRAAKARLVQWDGVLAPDSVAATLYAVWREMTAAVVLQSPALAALAASAAPLEIIEPMPLGARLRTTLLALLDNDDTSLLPEGETWAKVLAQALARAVAWLETTLGGEMDAWRWHRLHRTAPAHTLAATFPEHAALLDPPSVGVGGDGDTPQCGSYGGFGGSGFAITALSVNRYCFDPGDWDRSGWVVPLGASGHPGSPHYADQRVPWSEQRLLPMWYSWDAVRTNAAETQTLEPDA